MDCMSLWAILDHLALLEFKLVNTSIMSDLEFMVPFFHDQG